MTAKAGHLNDAGCHCSTIDQVQYIFDSLLTAALTPTLVEGLI